jgi:hypothetical protein
MKPINELDWELILKKPPVVRSINSSMALRNRIRVEVEKPKNKILNFPVKAIVTMVFLGIFVIAPIRHYPILKR